MKNLTVNKWGHSLGIRIPSKLAKEKNIEAGSEIEAIDTKEGILLKVVPTKLTMQDILDSIPDGYKDEDLIPNLVGKERW